MENVENKPNQTDPSQVTPAEAPAGGQEIMDRIAEAQKQMQTPNPIIPSAEEQKAEEPKGGSGSDVSTPKQDSSSVNADPNGEALKLIEASTGRKFDNVDEAKKYLSNLNSLVGDQSVAKARESAKLFDAFLSKWADKSGESVEAAKQFWADQLIAKTETVKKPAVETKAEVTADNKELSELKAQVKNLDVARQKAELLAKYPYATDAVEEIALLAESKGISQIEAFEKSPFKALLEAKSKEDSSKSPVVTSNNRIGFDTKKIQDLGAKVMSPKATEADREALVAEFLGLK